MRLVLLKDCVLGRKGEIVEVEDTKAAVLVRTGQARRHDFRDEVTKK